MSLSDHIHQLTRAHLRTGPNGKAYQVPALLDELREAVTPGHAGSAGGGDSGPPIPINPNALDLIGAIEREAREDCLEALGLAWNGPLEALLQNYPSENLSAEWSAYLEHVTLDWIDKINALLWPIKPRRKLHGKTCPACGLASYGNDRAVCLSLGCWDDRGEMAKIGDWEIACASCNAAWSGDQVSWLMRALDTPLPELTRAG